MAYAPDDNRDSRLDALIGAANHYHLDAADARDIVDHQVDAIRGSWDDVCDAAELTAQQRAGFMGHQFLNPHAFQ